MTSSKIQQQASVWLAQLHRDDEPRWDHPELLQWLNKDERHALAFANASADWFAAGELTRNNPVIEFPGSRVKSARSGWSRLVGLAAALVIGFGLWLSYPNAESLLREARYDMVAHRGELSQRTLDDGSVVMLAPGSALDLGFTSDQRLVELRNGQAFFDVAHDPDRPFQVRFDSGRVQVLGTAFGVSQGANAARVGVLRGRVEVSGRQSDGPLILIADESAVVDGDGPRSSSDQPVQQFAWASGRLEFDREPLREALRVLENFGSRRIVVLGNEARQHPVSAVIELDRIDEGIESIAGQAGLTTTLIAGLAVVY